MHTTTIHTTTIPTDPVVVRHKYAIGDVIAGFSGARRRVEGIVLIADLPHYRLREIEGAGLVSDFRISFVDNGNWKLHRPRYSYVFNVVIEGEVDNDTWTPWRIDHIHTALSDHYKTGRWLNDENASVQVTLVDGRRDV